MLPRASCSFAAQSLTCRADVALISYFTLLSTTASIIQQFRDYA